MEVQIILEIICVPNYDKKCYLYKELNNISENIEYLQIDSENITIFLFILLKRWWIQFYYGLLVRQFWLFYESMKLLGYCYRVLSFLAFLLSDSMSRLHIDFKSIDGVKCYENGFIYSYFPLIISCMNTVSKVLSLKGSRRCDLKTSPVLLSKRIYLDICRISFLKEKINWEERPYR